MKVELDGFDTGRGIQIRLIPETRAEELILTSISGNDAWVEGQEDDQSVVITCGVSNGE